MNESVQNWLDELIATPSTAIQKLVLGYSGVSAWSRSSLRESFVEIFQTHAEALDDGVTKWMNERLLKLPPEKTPTLVWASHLQDLFSGIAGLPLPRIAQLMRDQLRDFRSWLRPLRIDESIDPEASYLSALAWADTNQHLEGMWQGLALRRNHEPAYYTDIGLLGLRKTRDGSGRLPAKAPFLLLTTLIDLADTGIGQKEWLLTTRSLIGSYHLSLDTWVREFAPALAARPNAQSGPRLLNKILPSISDYMQNEAGLRKRPTPAFTLEQCNWFVSDIKRNGPKPSDDRLEAFLDSHRGYANITNYTHFLTRTFNRLAEAAKDHDPDWAIARAEEALEWNKSDPRNWTVLARSIWARAKRLQKNADFNKATTSKREALDTLWTARFRIPYNTYIRTELARIYREMGDLLTAESIYREASVEFPSDHAPLCGLAEILALQGKIDKAETTYRTAIVNFPNEAVPRDGLAAMFRDVGRSSDAENLYRETYRIFSEDVRCRTGLGDILFRLSSSNRDIEKREEARRLFQEAAALGSEFAYSRLKAFDMRWEEFAENPEPPEELAELHVEALPSEDILEMGPAQRLGRSLLTQWVARHTVDIAARDQLFSKAEFLLDLPAELTGECLTAFIEARGFLLLAKDQLNEARLYFEQHLSKCSRPSLGLRLGFFETRTRLGETLSDIEEIELLSFGPDGSILPLVLKIIRLLETNTPYDTLNNLLLELYPRVRTLIGIPPSELGELNEPDSEKDAVGQPETAETMMAQLLLTTVFKGAALNTNHDINASSAIPHALASLKSHQGDIFSVAEKLVLAS